MAVGRDTKPLSENAREFWIKLSTLTMKYLQNLAAIKMFESGDFL